MTIPWQDGEHMARSRVSEDTRVYRPARPRRKGSTAQQIVIIVSIFLLVGIIAAAAAVYWFLKNIPSTGPSDLPIPGPGERINLVVVGLDAGVNGDGKNVSLGGPQRTDTILLISVDTDTSEVAVISIPRDTRVRIPGRPGYEKINHAHAYGGIQLLIQTLSDFLEIPIHYYVRTDLTGFASMVDKLGGVEIEIERRMLYEDPLQGLKIDLYPGKQVLDGEKALQYVRFRGYADADIGRIRAQQNFINAFLKKFFQMKTIWQIPSLAQDLIKYVDTNLSPNEILLFSKMALSINRESIKMAILPGTDKWITDGGQTLSYWVADARETKRLIDEYVRGIDYAANAKIKVEIANGAGIDGLAARMSQAMGEQGYSIASVSNWETSNITITQIHSLSGNEDAIRNVVRSLRSVGIEPQIYKRVQAEPGADVRIVVGADYAAKVNQ